MALRGHNSLALLFAYLAVLECEARVAPLNPRLPTLDLGFGWSSEPAAWPSGMVPLEVDIARLLSSDPSGAETQPHRPSLPPADTPWDPQRLAALTLTSGSSGMPKAAAHRYAAHLCSAAGVVTLLDFQRVGCRLLSLPLYHVSGQGIVWCWLYAGARLLARHDGVRQVFIAPLADPEYGQRPVAVVDSDVPLATLRAWLEPQLSPWQRPVAWYYLPPTLNQGGIKMSRDAIHAWLAHTAAP